jgi:hypothetical protein
VASLGITGSGSGSEVGNKLYQAIQFQPADPYSVARKSFPEHEYILAIKITVQYYENPDVQASPLPS